MMSKIVYEDRWGEIIDRGAANYIEIRWYDTTHAMSGEQFNQWLSVFASQVETHKRSGALVDALQFRMPPAQMDSAWRDSHIIPRYNAAGIKKFAFIMPAGMPLIGKEPAPEGPGQFPTGYFGSRAQAVAWLAT